jgi:hypothetical protein
MNQKMIKKHTKAPVMFVRLVTIKADAANQKKAKPAQ